MKYEIIDGPNEGEQHWLREHGSIRDVFVYGPEPSSETFIRVEVIMRDGSWKQIQENALLPKGSVARDMRGIG